MGRAHRWALGVWLVRCYEETQKPLRQYGKGSFCILLRPRSKEWRSVGARPRGCLFCCLFKWAEIKDQKTAGSRTGSRDPSVLPFKFIKPEDQNHGVAAPNAAILFVKADKKYAKSSLLKLTKIGSTFCVASNQQLTTRPKMGEPIKGQNRKNTYGVSMN